MKQLIVIAMILTVAACGQPERLKSSGGPVSRGMPMAFGPISKACMASDRKRRSRELCGCIQAVADDTLSFAQQRRAVGFYRNPHEAQEIRQSDRARDEDFWTAYRAYGDQAERQCS
ncbi:hypothetical protein [Roseovarius aestuariivivens]|uniref:hypothetical protein n=1 Tax=Roseovarius aestuariivivens TaxID=1888910 RepID=UPI001FD8B749|nr:hypothetical protein [Roseovarius aestuariivivens]